MTVIRCTSVNAAESYTASDLSLHRNTLRHRDASAFKYKICFNLGISLHCSGVLHLCGSRRTFRSINASSSTKYSLQLTSTHALEFENTHLTQVGVPFPSAGVDCEWRCGSRVLELGRQFWVCWALSMTRQTPCLTLCARDRP